MSYVQPDVEILITASDCFLTGADLGGDIEEVGPQSLAKLEYITRDVNGGEPDQSYYIYGIKDGDSPIPTVVGVHIDDSTKSEADELVKYLYGTLDVYPYNHKTGEWEFLQ